MKLDKSYRITHKTYFNDRLQQSYFHGKLTRPLYAQVTFERKTTFFKSYYFDLFAKSRYAVRVGGKAYAPVIKDIIKKEETLIQFVIDKNIQKFSLDIFKKDYAFYCIDLLDRMEEGFLNYLNTFFHDEGMPFIGDSIAAGTAGAAPYYLIQDMKMALSPALYKKLIENSFYYAPPYLPLFGFALQLKKPPLLCLTICEWQNEKIKEGFTAYVNKTLGNKEGIKVTAEVEKWISGTANT